MSLFKPSVMAPDLQSATTKREETLLAGAAIVLVFQIDGGPCGHFYYFYKGGAEEPCLRSAETYHSPLFGVYSVGGYCLFSSKSPQLQ
jgi:hypothetical protein